MGVKVSSYDVFIRETTTISGALGFARSDHILIDFIDRREGTSCSRRGASL
jgi:hypothetical protein